MPLISELVIKVITIEYFRFISLTLTSFYVAYLLSLFSVGHYFTAAHTYKVLLESSRTIIVVTASVKEDERGDQGHISASLSLPRDDML
jgi:hypothetical protein